MDSIEEEELPPVSTEVAHLSNSFPFGTGGTWNTEKSLDIIYSLLPCQPRAWTLVETYMEHASWLFRPIKREELINDILSPVYKYLKERQDPISDASHYVSPHKLAVLFMIFALGALVDLTLPPYSAEAESYFHLSRAALSLRSVFDSPEMATVQAIVLMASYHSLGGRKYTMDSCWSLISFGAKLSQSVRFKV